MRPDLKPIETVYNGYRFRSRLEARWAVFLDALGVPYEYEREGFDLDGKWYLPDFYLPTGGASDGGHLASSAPAWLEVKPSGADDTAVALPRLFSMRTDAPVYVVTGQPYAEAADRPLYALVRANGMHSGHWLEVGWRQCVFCRWLAISQMWAGYVWTCERCGKHPQVNPGHPWYSVAHYTARIQQAYTRARKARFEHGRSGN